MEPTIQALPRLTRFAVMGLAGSLAAFITLACLTSSHPPPSSPDYRLLHDLAGIRTPWLTVAAKAATQLGTGPVLYPLLAGAGWLLWRRRGSAWPGLAALAWLWAGQLVRLHISRQIARPRPPQHLRLVDAGGFSFPSGHTSTAAIGYGLLAVLVIRLLPAGRRLWRAITALLSLMAVAAVGLSRVYLGVHWPSDVAAGWAWGIAWLSLGALAAALIPRRGHPAALSSDAAANRGTSE